MNNSEVFFGGESIWCGISFQVKVFELLLVMWLLGYFVESHVWLIIGESNGFRQVWVKMIFIVNLYLQCFLQWKNWICVFIVGAIFVTAAQ